MQIRTTAALLAMAGTLGACAASYVPVAGPEAAPPQAVERDLAECRRQVDADLKAAGKAAAGTAIGGALGAAEGSIAGAFVGGSAEGALIGLAVGAVVGLVAGIAAATEPDPALSACMSKRGYRAA